MALGMRRDPLLESLSEVGQNIRALSGDVLTRRRLDIQEGQQLAEAARERELAQLRASAQQATGERELLQTRGSLAQLGQQMELARNQDVRAEAQLGLQRQKTEFEIREGETLLPAKVGLMGSQAAAARANAGESAAGTRLKNLQASQVQQQVNFMNRPMTAQQGLATATALYGQHGAEAIMAIAPPEAIKTVGDFMNIANMAAKVASPDVQEMLLGQLRNRIVQTPDNDPAKPSLIQEYDLMRTDLGKTRAGQAPKPADVVDAAIDQSIVKLDTYARQPGRDWRVVSRLFQDYETNSKLQATHRNPEEAQMRAVQTVLAIQREFEPIARQIVQTDARFKGAKDPKTIERGVQEVTRELILEHGTPEHYAEVLQGRSAVPQATPATPAAPGNLSSATPLTPGAQQVREQQRARVQSLAGAQQAQQIQAQAAQEFTVFERNATSTGLAEIPDALRPQAKAAYVQLRAANPTLPPIEVLQAVRQQLLGAPQ